MHRVDERLHAGHAKRLPVTGEGIAPVAVQGLPSVVDYDRPEAQLRRDLDFSQERVRRHVLMVAVPGGIGRKERVLGDGGRRVPRIAGPPGRDVAQGPGVRHGAPVDSDVDTVVRERAMLLGKEANSVADGTVFFPNA